MKKLSKLTSLAALITATACTVKEQEVLPVPLQYEVFYATIEQPSETTDTKTYSDDQFRVLWHADDRITIFNRYTYNQEFAFQGETGDNAGGFSKVGDDEFVTGNDLPNIYAVYPYQKSTKISNDGVITVTLPSEQTWAEGSFGAGANTMVSATSDSKLKFRNTGSILSFKLYGSNVQVSNITLQGNSGERISGKATVTMPVGGTPSLCIASDATQSITLNCATPVTIGPTADNYTEFWLVVPPTDFTKGFTITVTCADGGSFEKATDKPISLERNHIYRMAPIEVIPVKPAAVPEYVDLGLPSGLKWATFNVGATSPEEFGDHFAWGETEPKSEYSGSNYKWWNGDKYKLTKYCTNSSFWDGSDPMDNKTVLDPEDDAAHVNWGGSWRMPTDEEWAELRNNCTWTWTAQNGVDGRLVTGPNGNSIFLPAIDYRYDTRLGDVGSYGNYWSSSLRTDTQYFAWFNNFNSSEVYKDYGYRCHGRSVRPVYDDRIHPVSVTLDKSELSLYVGASEILTATVLPSDATDKSITWSSSNESVATVGADGKVTGVKDGTAFITATTNDGGYQASCSVVVLKPMINGYEFVDLGLPSGLKWATCNIGANSPEESGDFFGWGEIEPNSHYNWDHYRFGNGSSFSKYNTQDGLTQLELVDDAAHIIWKGDWRMPTHDEELELASNCSIEQMTLNGVLGYKFTGPNGNSIFFPLGGIIDGTDYDQIDNEPVRKGDGGWYWSSTLSAAGSAYACGFCFWPSLMSDVIDHERCDGHMIRPVKSAGNNEIVVSIALPPDDEIWYESHSGNSIPLAEDSSLLVSNTYSNGKGIYKFSEALTEIGGMFDYSEQCGTTKENEDFKSLILPKGITHIGQFGISHLSKATKLVLPYNLSSMGSDCLCGFGEETPDTSDIYFIGETAPSYVSTSIWNMHDLASGGKKIDNFYYPEDNGSYNSLLKITIQGSATHYWVPTKYIITFAN